MRVKIGHKAVATLPPQTVIWDTEVHGFCARRQFSDQITYSVFYRSKDGRQHFYKLGRHGVLTPDIARKEAIRVLREVTLGGDPSAERYEARHGLTVSELCEMYQIDMQSGKLNGKKETTIKSDVSRIKNHIIPKLGKFKVATITSE